MKVDIEDRTDHLGKVFESKPKMCEYYGIDNGTYNTRIKKGMTKEQALTTPVKSISIEERTDHLGNVYDSLTQMCKHYGLYRSIYQDRIKKGWSKEEALTTPLSRNFDESNRTDHLGNVFKSKKEMCKFHNITVTSYEKRINKGMSKEEALTSRKETYSKEQDRTDHLGNVFNSVNQMCKYWKIGKSKYNTRIQKGWSKEKALTIKENLNIRGELEDRTDHLGNVFESIDQMCKYWNINPRTYKNRIRRGNWTKEKALTASNQSIASLAGRTDHLGNIFDTQRSMCDFYKVSISSFNNCLKDKHCLEEALRLMPLLGRKTKNLQITDNILIVRFVYEFDNIRYFECEIGDKGIKEILSRDDIRDAYMNYQKKETE